MTPGRILRIAKAKGEFSVTWHYRNDAVRQKCELMVRAGLLKRKRCAAGSDLYALPAPQTGLGGE